jgi:RNA recognition motif-containing protein
LSDLSFPVVPAGPLIAIGVCGSGCRPGNFFSFNFFEMNIFVAKLSFDTQSEDLREAFEAYGEVSSANVVMDKVTGRSRGFGFVEMDNDDEARNAIDELNDSDLDGRTIVVKKAEPRKENRRSNPRW